MMKSVCLALALPLAAAACEPSAQESALTASAEREPVARTFAKQECRNVEADPIGFAGFTLLYTVDPAGEGTLLSRNVSVDAWEELDSPFFVFIGADNILADAKFSAASWGFSDHIARIDIFDTENGELADMQLYLTGDLDGEKAKGVFKHTSDGPIWSQFVECEEFPFDGIAFADLDWNAPADERRARRATRTRRGARR